MLLNLKLDPVLVIEPQDHSGLNQIDVCVSLTSPSPQRLGLVCSWQLMRDHEGPRVLPTCSSATCDPFPRSPWASVLPWVAVSRKNGHSPSLLRALPRNCSHHFCLYSLGWNLVIKPDDLAVRKAGKCSLSFKWTLANKKWDEF